MKKMVVLICMLLLAPTAKADIFLATHLLLNTLAVNYLPEYESATYHGPTVSLDYGYRYEQGEAYKLGKYTKGSHSPSYGLRLG
jgi:hypothetical protein